MDPQARRRQGEATYRLVRYADDFVVLVRAPARTPRRCGRGRAVLAPMGLRLSEEKTRIAHIDEGFDFLGFRIQRHPKRGTNKRYVYTYPSKKALASIKAKVEAITRQGTNQPLAGLLRRLNPVLRGWTTYFRTGCPATTFGYLRAYTWRRVVGWLRRKHPGANWKSLRRALPAPGGGRRQDGSDVQPRHGAVTRYRYRGARHPHPVGDAADRHGRADHERHGLVESRMSSVQRSRPRPPAGASARLPHCPPASRRRLAAPGERHRA